MAKNGKIEMPPQLAGEIYFADKPCGPIGVEHVKEAANLVGLRGVPCLRVSIACLRKRRTRQFRFEEPLGGIGVVTTGCTLGKSKLADAFFGRRRDLFHRA